MPYPLADLMTAFSLNSPLAILILGHSKRDRDTYRGYLQADHPGNFRILEAQTPAEAGKIWRSQQPNLVIVDGSFPDGDGLTVLTALGEKSGDQELPAILLIVEPQDEPIALQAMQRGAQDYLIKSELSSALLRYSVRSVLERLALRRSLQQERIERQARSQPPRELSNRAIALPTADLHAPELDLPDFLDNVTDLHYAQGQVISTRGIFRDVTERRQIEAELADSEAKFRHLVEGAKDLIWACDIEGIFTYLSPQYQVIFGWEAQDWLGQSLAPLVHPEDACLVQAFTEKLFTLDEPSDYIEFRHLHKDGHYVWIQCKETLVRNREGIPIGFQGIIRDISDRKLAEQQLAEKNIILHSVIDGTPDIIFVKDLQGKYVVANAAFSHFLGKKIQEIIGRHDTEIFPPDLAQLAQASDHKILATGALETFEEAVHLQGIYTIFLTTKLPWRNAQGEIIGVIGIARDISDRKQAEAQLQATNQLLATSNRNLSRATRLKDEFLANMSHELRTPLNSILGMTECLQEGIFSSLNTQQLEAVSTIQKSSHHLLDLINDILDLAKIGAGKLELQRESVTVHSLCETSLLFVRELAYKKQIQLTLTLESSPSQIFVDRRRMMQVLINLLTNAVKFTPEGGQVSLIVGLETTTSLSFSVVDTGIGIAPEDLSQLFQPFLQIDHSLNRQQMGTGLGLSLVKRIMELHGGEVSVTSEVGVGSRFRIELPIQTAVLTAADSGNQPSLASFPPNLAPSSPLILLAEANEADVRSISSYLMAKGFRLRIAQNGSEAIAFAQTDRPNLILIDMQMPGMDGLATLRQMSRDRQLTHIPIIALTDLDLGYDRDRYLAEGAKDSLTKPIKLRLLSSIIQQNLSINP